METLRCSNCGTMLARFEPGSKIEIKCKKCGTMNQVRSYPVVART